MPEILRGCPNADGRDGPDGTHCYCGMDNMCCYCRLPLDQARDQQAPSLTTTAAQYRTRYAAPRYTSNNWFVDAPTTSTTVSWTPILTTNDEMIESAVFTEMISAPPEDDGSEEVKD